MTFDRHYAAAVRETVNARNDPDFVRTSVGLAAELASTSLEGWRMPWLAMLPTEDTLYINNLIK